MMDVVQFVAVQAAGGPSVATLAVGHGQDPHVLLWNEGLSLVRYLSALRREDGEVIITVQVAPRHPGERKPKARSRGRDRGLSDADVAQALVKQRIGCYSITLSRRGLLATRFANLGHGSRTWGLPGGGLEVLETPADAALREAIEETGQEIEIERLLDVQSDHWIGRAPNGVVEDFQALRIIYAAHCPHPSKPVVNDVGGTTAAAQWVPLSRWRKLQWSAASRALLETHLPALRARR